MGYKRVRSTRRVWNRIFTLLYSRVATISARYTGCGGVFNEWLPVSVPIFFGFVAILNNESKFLKGNGYINYVNQSKNVFYPSVWF